MGDEPMLQPGDLRALAKQIAVVVHRQTTILARIDKLLAMQETQGRAIDRLLDRAGPAARRASVLIPDMTASMHRLHGEGEE